MAKFNKSSSAGNSSPKKAKVSKEKVDEAFAHFSDKDTLEGFEQITQETIAIPFVRILQKLSPQLDKNKAEYVEGAQEGQWFNTITKEVYGEILRCIVLKFEHIYIEWRPERGGFVGYHDPENAARITVDNTFGKWKTEEGNALQENYVYLVLIAGHEKEGPVVISLASTMIKMARQWNRLMTTHLMRNGKVAKPYYLLWDLTTDYKSNDKGTWYAPEVQFVGYIDEEQYAITTGERKMLPSRRIDYKQLEQDTGRAPSDEVDDETEF